MTYPLLYLGGVKSLIQEIFQQHFPRYRQEQKIPLRLIKAGNAISQCRTSALGGHIQACPEGHVMRVWYNSCKHRSCPLCSFMQITRWIQRQTDRLLACDYYHTIFTIPSELNSLWEHNRAAVTNLLLQTAWQCLKELLCDPKYLGALPGAIASFHSWTQTLWIHPHAHFLLTGGGLSPQGQWLKTQKDFLLPSRVLMAKFRGKFLAMLRKHSCNLSLPPNLSEQQFLNLLNKLGRSKWHVMIMPAYRHGRGVIQYLGRYVRGGPLSDRRVHQAGKDSIHLRYKNETRTQFKFITFSTSEFIARILRHVPEPAVHHVRCYGLFAPSKRKELNSARALLGQLAVSEDQHPLTWQAACAQAGPEHPERCPVCGKPLIRIEFSPSGLSPPCQNAA